MEIKSQKLVLNIDELKRWITCFVVVTFDIDEGQRVSHIIPTIQFSRQMIKQLSMSSFPDSNSFNDYQNSFKYTFKLYNGLYGYTCFKQKKDPTNPRGFSQKSLVILSQLPFVQFFQQLSEFVVFKTFNILSEDDFSTAIASICQQICKWPNPVPKAKYTLPILQYSLQIQIPNYIYPTQKPANSQQPKPQQQLKPFVPQSQKTDHYNLKAILSQEQLLRQGPFHEIKLFQIFKDCHQTLWAIWQCVILNKSMIIIGSNPQQTSHAVLGAISLIYPFFYSGNYNPYLTIYDINLQKLTKQQKNIIMGGTNPLFYKLFTKSITKIIPLINTYKCQKYLKPINKFLLQSNNQQQQVINQSSTRKYFYKINNSIKIIIDQYLNKQINVIYTFYYRIQNFLIPQNFSNNLKTDNVISNSKTSSLQKNIQLIFFKNLFAPIIFHSISLIIIPLNIIIINEL